MQCAPWSRHGFPPGPSASLAASLDDKSAARSNAHFLCISLSASSPQRARRERAGRSSLLRGPARRGYWRRRRNGPALLLGTRAAERRTTPPHLQRIPIGAPRVVACNPPRGRRSGSLAVPLHLLVVIGPELQGGAFIVGRGVLVAAPKSEVAALQLHHKDLDGQFVDVETVLDPRGPQELVQKVIPGGHVCRRRPAGVQNSFVPAKLPCLGWRATRSWL